MSAINFTVREGERVALVGPSGSGKTTLFKLLLRLYRPDSGHIRLRGKDIGSIPLEELRQQIAFVPQEPWIFPGTVLENIALGRPGASRSEIVRAATLANAHEFISALPQGYDTLLTERGGNLSGGERQRICLARAFLKDAPVLLLDEPTSSVDSESERLIADALNRLCVGRTVITISHTGRILKGCDLVLRLDGGQIRSENLHA
ncbi:MAG TPA: ATP-binding cassette domain-containing protein [Firmicutes bacterium]|nr:ATP-binding cassette domain-containing protein [Candidatus Fermentithermobacillaceae bacterium]